MTTTWKHAIVRVSDGAEAVANEMNERLRLGWILDSRHEEEPGATDLVFHREVEVEDGHHWSILDGASA